METIPLEKRELKEMLIQCWMTHDAMWMYYCMQECGMEMANKVSRAAARGAGALEIRRLKKAMGITKIQTFEAFWDFFSVARESFAGDFMKCSFETDGRNRILCSWRQCFAHDSMSSLDFIDQYECSVMPRLESWFDSLGVAYEVAPRVKGCMMHTEGRCYRDYTFFFDR